jgi:hypothetical protein
LFRYPRQSCSAYQTPFVSLWMWIEALGGEWGGIGRQIAPCRDISVPTITCTGGGKPLLNGSGSYLPQNSGSDFGLGVGVIHSGRGNCGIPATLGADLAVNGR